MWGLLRRVDYSKGFYSRSGNAVVKGRARTSLRIMKYTHIH
jgi:hypothetical protein